MVDVGCEGVERYGMYVFEHPVSLLKKYGLDTSDITDVIITHSHFDHIDLINYYKNARIYIHKDEFENLKKVIEDCSQVHVFDNEYEIEKDICVELFGGHSKGSCVVFADKYILCGDEAYFKRNLDDKVRVGNSYCKERSQEFVNIYNNT